MSSSRPKILVVDSGSQERKALVSMLKAEHIDVVETAEGASAVEKARESATRIVFVDAKLPDISAADLTVRLMDEFSDMLVCALAGEADYRKGIDLVRAGAIDLILKPVQQAHLQTVLSRLMWRTSRLRARRFRPDTLSAANLSLSLVTSEQSIQPTVSLLCGLLTGLVPRDRVTTVERALHEILRNAVEHGALGISSAEKHSHYGSGQYEEIVRKRGVEKRGSGGSIEVFAVVENGTFRVVVRDPGPGFDWRAAMACADAPQSCESVSGRGLIIIRQAFDDVVFNEAGNEIAVYKKIG